MISRRQFLGHVAVATVCCGSSVLFSPSMSMARSSFEPLRHAIKTGRDFVPLRVGVPNFAGDEGSGAAIAQIVSEDLKSSGYFVPLESGTFEEQVLGYDDVPDFIHWRSLNVYVLVTASIIKSENNLILRMKVWDVFSKQALVGRELTTVSKNIRRLAHVLSDQVYTAVTGFDGMFDSCLTYISETGAKNARIKRLAMSDWNGLNTRYLTDGKTTVIMPVFDASRGRIAYTSLDSPHTEVVILDIRTNTNRRLPINTDGATYASCFSPDGNYILFSMQRRGNANLFSMNFRTKKIRQLTSGLAIDTSPSFSPDGSLVVFESDRSGTQQLYVMRADGSGQSRITFGSGIYSTPSWSPDLDNPLIVFTKRYAGSFGIGLIKPDGSGERMIAYGYHYESPTWAPNGRHVIFVKEDFNLAGPGLVMVDIFGNARTKIDTGGFASDPFWSPVSYY